MTHKHRFWISIPINIDVVENIQDGMAWEDVTFEDVEITREDYEKLWKLFSSFDAPSEPSSMNTRRKSSLPDT